MSFWTGPSICSLRFLLSSLMKVQADNSIPYFRKNVHCLLRTYLVPKAVLQNPVFRISCWFRCFNSKDFKKYRNLTFLRFASKTYRTPGNKICLKNVLLKKAKRTIYFLSVGDNRDEFLLKNFVSRSRSVYGI